jgi:hypothetical protein
MTRPRHRADAVEHPTSEPFCAPASARFPIEANPIYDALVDELAMRVWPVVDQDCDSRAHG